ncbi:hypothetical protein TWF730_001808 [Orbilia blumenaviensis]|uniref:Peptidase A1 domain-containing protein n=1 Tax=Orbilia blumenaviensis TaxID=1796055 RepID=A0AAV9UGA1_9PEZI
MAPYTQPSAQILQKSILGLLYAGLFVCTLTAIFYVIRVYRLSKEIAVGREIVALEKRSLGVSSVVRREDSGGNGRWVVLPVRYDYTALRGFDNSLYTDVFVGDDRQPITLAVTLQQVTWVPQLPASRTAFCGNLTNEDGCAIAAVSGYYRPPTNVSGGDVFRLEGGSNSTASGFWTESTLTAGSTSIPFEFGVATLWQNLVPSLGLGIYPVNRSPTHPSYLDALLRQGKIAGQYVSCYDISNPDKSGEIVIGGVDTGKYVGNLKVLKGGAYPGMVGSPGVMVATGQNSSFGIGEVGKWALLTPDTRFLWLPQPIVYNIISAFPVTTYNLQPGNSFPVYTVPCDTKFDPSWAIELTFEGVVINIPFNHLITSIEVTAGGPNRKRCVLAVQPNDGRYILPGYTFSYILGGPFWRSAYVVLNPRENITAIAAPQANAVSQSIVPLGGEFGTNIQSVEGSPGSSSSTSTNNSQPQQKKGMSVGVIVGVSIAGAVALLLIALGIFSFYRRKRRMRKMEACEPPDWNRVELPWDGQTRTNGLHEDFEKRRTGGTPLEGRAELPAGGQQERYELPGSMHIGVAP